MKNGRYETFAEFWPYYVSEHSQVSTRVLHILGTTAGVLAGIYAGVTSQWLLLPLALVLGYGPAWASHFFIEHNRPATFKYPFWSLRADFVMMAKVLTGRFPKTTERNASPLPPNS